eukprot:scaffold30266_cov78-Phaeocystis_antarctica.AAC.1
MAVAEDTAATRAMTLPVGTVRARRKATEAVRADALDGDGHQKQHHQQQRDGATKRRKTTEAMRVRAYALDGDGHQKQHHQPQRDGATKH